jgi:hypothetical protein
MRLISFSPEHLQSEEVLPFDVFDADGSLLLPARERLNDRAARLALHARQKIFAEARAVAAWRRRLAQRVDALVRSDALLSVIAKARAEPGRPLHGDEEPAQVWEALVYLLNTALRDPTPEQGWLERLLLVHARVRELSAHRMDEALLYYFYSGARHAEHYSSHQSLRCMLVCGEVARALGWDTEHIELLEIAALTMNVTMRRLQDRLALQTAPLLDPAVRAQIAGHAAEAAQLLSHSGVTEPAWLEAVRGHHDDSLEPLPFEQLTAGQRLALLLRRVDIYCAKLSRRAGRVSMTAMQAASEVCLGADGRPDLLGGALLKAMGLYPPGSFVQLANGELGIVLSRGARANQPLVAVLVNAHGLPLPTPLLRVTSQPNSSVRAGLRPDQVPVRPSMDQLHALGATVAVDAAVHGGLAEHLSEPVT